jgi:hypothetical protein
MTDPGLGTVPAAPGDGRVTWWQCEPRRLARDQREIGEAFPDLRWDPARAGIWNGRLPAWPFTRPEPQGLHELINGTGLLVQVRYGHAYPVVPPAIVPLDPVPDLIARTQHQWHTNGNGSLCLLQSDAAWTGRDSIVGLLLKAAGWRIEYELMRLGLLETMSMHGIVSDPTVDALIPAAADRTVASDPPAGESAQP